MIRIKTVDGRQQVTMPDGTIIPGIEACFVEIGPLRCVATLTVRVEAIDIEAHPLLTLPTLHASAAARGLMLAHEVEG